MALSAYYRRRRFCALHYPSGACHQSAGGLSRAAGQYAPRVEADGRVGAVGGRCSSNEEEPTRLVCLRRKSWSILSEPISFAPTSPPPAPSLHRPLPYSDEQVANRNDRDFGWGIAHGAFTRRPPIPLDTMVPRTESYMYDVGVWDFPIIQGPFSVRPRQTPHKVASLIYKFTHVRVEFSSNRVRHFRIDGLRRCIPLVVSRRSTVRNQARTREPNGSTLSRRSG